MFYKVIELFFIVIFKNLELQNLIAIGSKKNSDNTTKFTKKYKHTVQQKIHGSWKQKVRIKSETETDCI